MLTFQPGDVLVFITGSFFGRIGMTRLSACIRKNLTKSPLEMITAMHGAIRARAMLQQDDLTAVVVRQHR